MRVSRVQNNSLSIIERTGLRLEMIVIRGLPTTCVTTDVHNKEAIAIKLYKYILVVVVKTFFLMTGLHIISKCTQILISVV